MNEKEIKKGQILVQERFKEFKKIYSVTDEELDEFLKSGEFKAKIDEMMGRAIEMEQGMILAYSPKKKFVVVWDKDVSPNTTTGDYEEVRRKRLLQIARIHVHPLSEILGQFLDYIPSPSDLIYLRTEHALFYDDETDENYQINLFGGLIISGGRPVGWLWGPISLNQRQIERIYNDWKHSLSGNYHLYGDIVTMVPSYREVEDLLSDLKSWGIQIERRELTRDDIAGSLAAFVHDMHFEIGFA